MTRTPLDYETPQPKARWSFPKLTILELGVVICIVVVLMAILLPALDTREGGSPQIACVAHLRNLGIALMQYAQQNQGVYPAKLVDVCQLKRPPEMFVCPASKS
jgi:hypothetical protein